MNVAEIRAAIDSGRRVFWANLGYEVLKWPNSYEIVCRWNQSAIGLTWADGTTLNGRPEEFFIHDGPVPEV